MTLLQHHKDIFYLVNKYSASVSRLEAETLLSRALACSRSELYTRDIIVSEDIENAYDLLMKRCLAGEPLQYITGLAEFMGMDFIVDKGVFIPRPETEVLVEEVFHHASRITHHTEQGVKILDLCTGSGNIAVSLAKALPGAELTATDISESALETARKNTCLHNVDGRIKFCKGDLFDAICFDINYKFDIIVCNPPYIKKTEIGFLQKEVKEEPFISLNGGLDGLEFYRRIADDSPSYLKRDGSLFLEIGAGQAKDIKEIFESNGIFKVHRIIKDPAGIERVMWIGLL